MKFTIWQGAAILAAAAVLIFVEYFSATVFQNFETPTLELPGGNWDRPASPAP